MANSNTPYTREGDINAWNDLIRKINLQAAECNLVPLEEVDENHILAKSDIRDAQNKLVEACIDNEFTPIPDRWLVQTIQELEDIAASDPCCCEEDDIIFPNLFNFFLAGFNGDRDIPNQSGALTFDWAGWMMQEREPLVITPVDCGEDDPPVETRTDGRGWVGTEFRLWEMFMFDELDPNPAHTDFPIATGNVVDGYVQPGEGSPIFLRECGEPDQGIPTLGENDPGWTFLYGVEITDFEVVGFEYRLFSLNNAFNLPKLLPSFFFNHGLLPIGIPTAPMVVDVFFPQPSTVTAFLRVKC